LLEVLSPLIDMEQAKQREIIIFQARFILKTTHFTWARSPISVLQDRSKT